MKEGKEEEKEMMRQQGLKTKLQQDFLYKVYIMETNKKILM